MSHNGISHEKVELWNLNFFVTNLRFLFRSTGMNFYALCPQPGRRLSLDEERGSHGMHELVSNGQVRGSSCADLNVYDARNSLTDVTLPLSVTL